MLPLKFPSPLYFAVMECEPGVKFETVTCAALLDIAAVPREVVPSRNVIVPVTEPPYAGTTFAVNVTACANVAGFALEEMSVVVVAEFIVSVSAVDVLAAKFASPLYFAVRLSVPTGRLETFSCARLFDNVIVPNEVPPFKNVTVPVAVPLPGG